MLNKFKISHRTIKTILQLRDEENCSWEAIELITGHAAGTCRDNYKDYKENNGNVFYFSEFLETIRKKDMENLTMKDAYALCVSMGYSAGYHAFRGRKDVLRLPLKRSTTLKRKRIQRVFQMAKLNPNKSLRDLVWEIFHDYSREGKYRILQELSEISYV